MVDAASPPPGVDLALCTPDNSNNRCCVDIVSYTCYVTIAVTIVTTHDYT